MNNEYVFVRHGQTYWNKNGVMHGQYDIPLNYTGVKQAKAVAQELKGEHFDLCFCSPLKRAKSTAFSILLHHKNTEIHFDDRLMEQQLAARYGVDLTPPAKTAPAATNPAQEQPK